MIFGSGIKTKQWLLDDGRILLLQWHYSHILWCPAAYKLKWFILEEKRSDDKEISKEEAIKLLPLNTKPLNIWQMYGGYILIGILVLLGLFGF